jgi:hypothetical protein
MVGAIIGVMYRENFALASLYYHSDTKDRFKILSSKLESPQFLNHQYANLIILTQLILEIDKACQGLLAQ